MNDIMFAFLASWTERALEVVFRARRDNVRHRRVGPPLIHLVRILRDGGGRFATIPPGGGPHVVVLPLHLPSSTLLLLLVLVVLPDYHERRDEPVELEEVFRLTPAGLAAAVGIVDAGDPGRRQRRQRRRQRRLDGR